MHREYNVLALVKGHERYVYVYDDGDQELLLQTMENHAANPHLSFNWFDAAVLRQRSQEQLNAGAEADLMRQFRSTETS